MSSTATANESTASADGVGAVALAPVNARLSAEEKIELFRQMVRIRRFEEFSIRAYQQRKIGGFCHTYIGQEAVAVGSISVLGADDHIITAYRDHGHALAVGMTMNECMAELYGKYTGCSKGKGGSMHFFAPKRNFWGGHGIVGGQTPLGAGLAFALKYLGKSGCCLCYLGDGAVNQGAFHESLNLAALWKLPVIYIIENNYYSMGTSQTRSSAGSPLAKRAEAYDMEWDVINGNDLYEVREKTEQAVRRAHEDHAPAILEMQTYRFRGHSMSDPEKYRTKDEVEERKQNDPIILFRRTLEEEGVLDEEAAETIDQEARAEAKASADFADQSPEPPAEELFTDIYKDDAQLRASLEAQKQKL
ncbi:MAG: pyruvate dehydrogenase (acetyl-transferring) E1 component subunit alpha [Puniceicoccaceae bacterium]|nr:MAG: pyruvate dehydrogenase (acetyl-transferring) E1 component subunit alpha [Puniceicoccaceae bacterium]